MFAEIIVNSSAQELNRVFDYKVPEGYKIGENIDIGYRVLVSFANYKSLEIGYIIGFKETSDFKCKNISKVCDRAFDEKKFELAKWIARRYFCNLSDALRLLVPPGTSNNIDKVKIKYERWARLTKNYLMYVEQGEDDGEKKYKIKSEKQKKIIEFLKDNIEIPVAILFDVTDTNQSVLKALEEKDICESFKMEVLRNPFLTKHIKHTDKLPLTNSQQKVLDAIKLNKFDEYLLFGVTRKW